MEGNQFTSMWQAAQDEYCRITGDNFDSLPSNVSADTLTRSLQLQTQDRAKFNKQHVCDSQRSSFGSTYMMHKYMDSRQY